MLDLSTHRNNDERIALSIGYKELNGATTSKPNALNKETHALLQKIEVQIKKTE